METVSPELAHINCIHRQDYYSNEVANELDREANNLINRYAADQLDALNRSPLAMDQTEYDVVPEKRKSVRLRFGRSYSVHEDIVSYNPCLLFYLLH